MEKTEAQLKVEVKKLLHAITNCEQAVIGYYELGEYRKAYVVALECRGEMATLAARLAELDGLKNPN